MPVSFWVKGVPRSLAAQKKEAYTALIQEAARAVFKKPAQSPRIDVEIIFAAKDRNLRADVDNVAKPILDALKGIVYDDDKQVRSVRIVALPLDDAFKLPGEASQKSFARLLECQEFLVVVKEGLAFPSGISFE